MNENYIKISELPQASEKTPSVNLVGQVGEQTQRVPLSSVIDGETLLIDEEKGIQVNPANVVSKEEVTDLASKVRGITGEAEHDILSLIDVANKKIIYNDGAIGDRTSYKTSNLVKVYKGQVITYALRTPATDAVIAFYSSSDISSYNQALSVAGSGGLLSGTYEVNQDGYVAFGCRELDIAEGRAKLTLKQDGRLIELEGNVETLTDGLAKTNYNIDGLINSVSGESGQTTGYRRILNVGSNGQEVYISATSTGGAETGQWRIFGTIGGTSIDGDNMLVGSTDFGEKVKVVIPEDGYIFFFTTKNSGYDSVRTYTISIWDKDAIQQQLMESTQKADEVKSDLQTLESEKTPFAVRPMPKKIVCFGDSMLGNDGETIEHLRKLTGSEIVNCAVGGTSVSNRISPTDPYYPFDGENLITAVTSNDYAAQEATVSRLATSIRTRLTNLEQMDWSTVELIVLAWGSNDYTQGKTISEITSALGSCIDMIQSTYPLIRILVLTNTWRFWQDSDSDTKVFNVSTGKEIANAIEDFCKDKRISVLNGYQSMPVSMNNATTFFDFIGSSSDDADGYSGVQIPAGSGNYYSGTHFNLAGNKMYAQIIEGKIRSIW